MWGEVVPRSPLGAERACGGSSPSLAALARLGAGLHYAKLLRTPLSPTSRQHAWQSAVLALGLSSSPPNPQAGAQHGAIIAIPDAARATAAFRRSFWPFCMRGRRTKCYIGALGTSRMSGSYSYCMLRALYLLVYSYASQTPQSILDFEFGG